MTVLNKREKSLFIAITAVAIALIVSMPYVYAAPINVENEPAQKTRNLVAKGIAIQKIEDDNVKTPASLTLALTPSETSENLKRFNVASGTVEVNGITYTITSGNGAALTGRCIVLLRATGTDQDGNEISLKLAGRYFWMGGNLFVLRMIGKLETSNTNYLLLLRAAIRV